MCARAKTGSAKKAWYSVRTCGGGISDGEGSIPQIGNGKLCTSNGGADLDSSMHVFNHGPSYFSFSLPTRAIDKEGRSTLSRTLSHGIRPAAQSLGIVSGSTPAPCFSSFLPLISLNSGAPDSSTRNLDFARWSYPHISRQTTSKGFSQRRRSLALSLSGPLVFYFLTSRIPAFPNSLALEPRFFLDRAANIEKASISTRANSLRVA